MTDLRSPALPEPDRYGAGRRGRRQAWILAIILHILVATILALQKRETFVKMAPSGLKAFLLPAEKKGSDEPRTEPRQARQEKQVQHASAAERPPAPIPPPEVQLPPKPADLPMPFIVMSREDFASSNIARMPSQRQGAATQAADSRAVYGPGSGPGGVTMYPADWFREPTNTELSTYIPPNAPRTGWGEIACKTMERYRVDNCYILGEFPRGSGLGRAVLNAAWQFQVMPPRRNGQPLLGTWVSIHIDYTQTSGFSAR